MRKDQKNLRRLRRTVANAKRDLRKGVVPESQIAGLEMAIARAESAIPKSSVGRWDRPGRRV
jgi:outer membrane protein TolC